MPALNCFSRRRRRAGMIRRGAAPHPLMPGGAGLYFFTNLRVRLSPLVSATRLPRLLGGGAPDALLCPEARGSCGLPGEGLSE
ncbi:hypothetical protein NDU88_005177 [Pleurodeles waltl]|uniref:Uncharacterized protein n=1 Tax=Pleurodeles waltl TaxID=8319 RepID=A0AAV7RLI8_PLEWA|nr:hypothetical protein NDU88_005177 [Pleurodeles waltl]